MTDLRAGAQQALEALETLMLERGSIYETAITALRTALAQEHALHELARLGQEIEQEPVISAWSLREVYFDEDGEPSMHRSPPAAPEQEPVAFYHPHKGFYWAKPTHISAPTAVDVPPVPLYVKWIAAKRPWQGLTEDDWAAIGDMPDTFDQGVAWAQARLKERNHG